MSERTTEIEAKLRAHAALGTDEELLAHLQSVAPTGTSVTTIDRRSHVDIYLDDARLHLARLGIGLRVRTAAPAAGTGPDDESRAIEWKVASRPNDRGIFRSDEVRAAWNSADTPRVARDLPHPIRRHVESFVYRAALQPIVEMTTERTRFEIVVGFTRLELVVDRARARGAGGGDAEFAFEELEIELDGGTGDMDLLRSWALSLARDLPVEPASNNKLAHALEALEQLPAPDRRAASLPRTAPAREFCTAWLREAWTKLQRCELQTAHGWTRANIDRLRLAAETVLSGFVVFARYLPAESNWAEARAAIHATLRQCRTIGNLDALRATLQDGLSPTSTTTSPNRFGQDATWLLLDRLEGITPILIAELGQRLSASDRQQSLERFQEALDGPLHRSMTTRAQVGTVASAALRSGLQRLHATRSSPRRLRATVQLDAACQMFAHLYADRLDWLTKALCPLSEHDATTRLARSQARWLAGWAARARVPHTALLTAGAWLHELQGRIERAQSRAEFAFADLALDATEATLKRSLRKRPAK